LVHTVKRVGASLLAMDVNDDAGCPNERGAWAFFASRARSYTGLVHTVKRVGASLLAMDVNDDAGCLNERGAWAFFASRARSYTGLGSHGQKGRSQLAGDGC